MDLDAILVTGLMISFCTFGTALAFTAAGWWRSAKRVRHLERQLRSIAASFGEDGSFGSLDERFESVEGELARLSDKQDFLGRIVTEAQHRAMEPPRRHVTPT